MTCLRSKSHPKPNMTASFDPSSIMEKTSTHLHPCPSNVIRCESYRQPVRIVGINLDCVRPQNSKAPSYEIHRWNSKTMSWVILLFFSRKNQLRSWAQLWILCGKLQSRKCVPLMKKRVNTFYKSDFLWVHLPFLGQKITKMIYGAAKYLLLPFSS